MHTALLENAILFQKKKKHFLVFSLPSSDRVGWSSLGSKKKIRKEWVGRVVQKKKRKKEKMRFEVFQGNFTK